MAVIFSDPDTVASALFAPASNDAMQYIQQGVQNYLSMVADVPTYIRDKVLSGFENFRESEIGRQVQAVRYKIRNFWQDDSIRPIWDVGSLQQAPNAMVRWIMANPSVREYYHDGRIEGYGDRYVDPAPEVAGRDFYDYRQATDGIIGPQYTLRELEEMDTPPEVVPESYVNYYEPLLGMDTRLQFMDKAAIQIAWSVAEDALDEGISDPTSEWNALIG